MFPTRWGHSFSLFLDDHSIYHSRDYITKSQTKHYMIMEQVENRIFIEREIFLNEYAFYYGSKRSVGCYMAYYSTKKGTETHSISGNYRDCLSFARYRAHDGRYKNFEFLIYVEK